MGGKRPFIEWYGDPGVVETDVVELSAVQRREHSCYNCMMSNNKDNDDR